MEITMRNKKQFKYLKLNKVTIANMDNLKGGRINYHSGEKTITLNLDLRIINSLD